jgi:hypothetical protein
VVVSVLYAWPAIERRITGDHRRHDLLDRPRDTPWRTAFGAAFFTWIAVSFIAGAADRLLVDIGLRYQSRCGSSACSRSSSRLRSSSSCAGCRELATSEVRPLRAWTGTVVRRAPDGAFEELRDAPRPSTAEEA